MLSHDKTRSNVRAGELLDQVRQYYLDQFIKIRDELLAEQNTRLILDQSCAEAMAQSSQKEPFNSPSAWIWQ